LNVRKWKKTKFVQNNKVFKNAFIFGHYIDSRSYRYIYYRFLCIFFYFRAIVWEK
jgi:hypothetical protein